MKNILIVVDCQNDFITGALRNEEAIKRVPNIVNYIKNNDWDGIFLTRDTHSENYMQTLEGKRLPVPHCIEGTWGWEVCDEVKEALKGKDFGYIDKYTFGYTHWDEVIESYLGNCLDDITFTLVGYCTDICVLSNATILKATWYNSIIRVKEDCCAGVTNEAHETALKALQSIHIDII